MGVCPFWSPVFLQINFVVNLEPQRKSRLDVLSYTTRINNLLRNRHWIHTWRVHVLQLFGWLSSIGHWQLLARLTFCDQISGKQFGQSGFEHLQSMISRNVFHPLLGTKKSGPCKTTGIDQQLFVVDSCIITFTDLPWSSYHNHCSLPGSLPGLNCDQATGEAHRV